VCIPSYISQLQADALAASDCASMLALKGQELQAFVVEASKVMSAAAESDEALSALEVNSF